MISRRDSVLPIVDLRTRFNLGVADRTDQSRIVVVELGEHTVGVIVDAVTEVLRLPPNSVEPPPSLVARVGASYSEGIAKANDRLIIMLDIEKALSNFEKGSQGFIVTERSISSIINHSSLEIITYPEHRDKHRIKLAIERKLAIVNSDRHLSLLLQLLI